MKCGKCGKEIPENARFCSFCGAKAEAAVIKSDVRFCAACGTKIAENARFCNKCGAKVSDAVEAANTVLKKIIARLTDGDCTASSTPGEMNLPVTEAQNMFMKMISKGL